MRPIRVADPDDPRLALYRGVRDPELLRRHGVFLAEGRLVVLRLLQHSPFRARSVLVTPAARASLADALETAACPVYLVDQSVVDLLTGFHIHRGCLALGERGAPPALDALIAASGPLLLLEDVGNPDNVGGAFRNAAALGAAGVVLSSGCSDPLYRKAIRTSMGAALTLPFIVVEDWAQTLRQMARAGRTIVALTPSREAEDLHGVAARLRGQPIALLLGHEGHGLSATALDAAAIHARIPMTAGSDSLNVAAAAAIALYEVRKASGAGLPAN